MESYFAEIADAVKAAIGEDLDQGEPWESAGPKMVRAFTELARQRDAAVKALADGVHRELAPATAELLGKRVIGPGKLEAFFEKIAHGPEKHREWLRKEFNDFWGTSIQPPVTQFDEHIWATGCNYQSDGWCNKCGQEHKQTYKEAHGDTGPLGKMP